MASTNTTLPQPREHPESLNTGVNQEKQTFNTAGQASLRKVTKPSVLPKLPQLPSANGMVLSPSRPVTATPVAIATGVAGSGGSHHKESPPPLQKFHAQSFL